MFIICLLGELRVFNLVWLKLAVLRENGFAGIFTEHGAGNLGQSSTKSTRHQHQSEKLITTTKPTIIDWTMPSAYMCSAHAWCFLAPADITLPLVVPTIQN